MAIPDRYSETTLAEFMLRELRSVAGELGWSDTNPDGDFQDAVDDTLVLYGVNDIDNASNIPKLRALARYAVWKAAQKDAASHTDFSADGGSFSEDQLYQHVTAQLNRATMDARPFLPATELSSSGGIDIEVTW